MRPIDADAPDVEQINCYYGDHCRTEDVQEWLEEAPTIDYAPVRHGEWIEDRMDWKCSCCDITFNDNLQYIRLAEDEMPKYCPHCGAKMDGGKENG